MGVLTKAHIQTSTNIYKRRRGVTDTSAIGQSVGDPSHDALITSWLAWTTFEWFWSGRIDIRTYPATTTFEHHQKWTRIQIFQHHPNVQTLEICPSPYHKVFSFRWDSSHMKLQNAIHHRHNCTCCTAFRRVEFRVWYIAPFQHSRYASCI